MTALPTIAVGLSGGVDSSLTAALLVSQGFPVVGLTMKIWAGGVRIQEGLKHACYGPGEEEDIAACERLCRQLGIPFHVVDLSAEYEKQVLEYFRQEYRRGRTPNPCVMCNHTMKFGFLLERAREAGVAFDRFATGHYARIAWQNGLARLRTAADLAKDQTYFLYRLSQETLARLELPLGGLSKAEVRARAHGLGLEVADKAESQDFVAGGDYAPLFANEDVKPGDIVDEKGKVLGTHRGIVHYTIGQRKGLGLGGSDQPLYVTRIDPRANRVVVSSNASLFAEGLRASELALALPSLAGTPFQARVRVRQNHQPVPSTVTVVDGQALVRFETPQRAVTPGQSTVFYDEEGYVLGGGIIEESLRLEAPVQAV